jgi:uncharacterized protein (TIGR02246 family)
MSNAEIAAVNRAFEDAFRKGEFARIASLYTPDGMVLPPDAALVKGREGIEKFWTAAAQQLGIKDVALHTLDLEVAGDMAAEVGEAVLTLTSGSVVVKFVVVWKRAGGQWRLHRDIWNGKGA